MRVDSKYDRAVRDEEGERIARAVADRLIAVEIDTANALERMTRRFAFVYPGASSIVHFGGMLGLDRRQAIRLSAAGRAFRLMPELERKVRAKELPLASAAALAKVLEHPTLRKDAWEWLKAAGEKTPDALARAIRKAIAEADAKANVEEVTLFLRPEVRDKMGRVREIVSRRAGEVLSNELVVELTLDYWLEREDPDRVPEGTRRKGSTVRDPSRAIPASEKRKVLRRGRKCQVPGCSHHLFLYFCHRKWHASGGSREAENIVLACGLHHWLLDRGLITCSGPSEDPTFRNSRGEVIRGPPGG